MADYNSTYTGAQIDTRLGLAGTAQQPPAEGSFVDGDKTKLDGVEALADVTDTANVTAAGALMDSEVTNLAAVKAFDPTDYATAAQGGLADSAVQPADDASGLGSGAATDGYVLTADGVGGAAWEEASGGGGTPAGLSGQFQFNNGGIFAAADLWQSANVIEQRNSTNAQTYNLYNTYTDASNYERGFVSWSGDILRVGTGSAGTGGLRSLGFYQGSTRYQIIGGGFNQFDQPIYMNTTSIATGAAGFKICTATTQGLGFWGATPVVQPGAVADATDAATAITQLNALLAHMRTIGMIAT